MLKRFFYSIEGFEPRDDLTLGKYGFSIFLDKEFAKRALEKELPEAGYKNMIDMTKKIIITEGLEKRKDMIVTPYNFVNRKDRLTCLLQSCTVPGNACNLSARWDDLEEREIKDKKYKNYIGYHPHNIDTSFQVHALLWLMWQRLVESVIEEPNT